MSRVQYMLDTNIVSDLIRSPQGRVFDRIAALGSDAMCVSIITAAELRYGCTKKGSPRLLAQVEAILTSIEILAFDVPADAEYAGIRAELEAAGKPIGPNDLLIAAHAYAIGATLVTANVGEFERIRGLRIENWDLTCLDPPPDIHSFPGRPAPSLCLAVPSNKLPREAGWSGKN